MSTEASMTARRLFDLRGGEYWSGLRGVQFFREHRHEFGEFIEAHLFRHDDNAILAGFFDLRDTRAADVVAVRFRDPVAPGLVLRDEHGQELWLAHCNCGYGGQGPGDSATVLGEAGFADELVEAVFRHQVLTLRKNQPTPVVAHASKPTGPGQILIVDGRPTKLAHPRPVWEAPALWAGYRPAWLPTPDGALLFLDHDTAVEKGYSHPVQGWRHDAVYPLVVEDSTAGRVVWVLARHPQGWRATERWTVAMFDSLQRVGFTPPFSLDTVPGRVRALLALQQPVLRFGNAVLP